MAQQSSRLNRLLTLLDTGSTQFTRFSAARQIGDIARSHPQDLASLLKKVAQYLHSRNWDTRVAAAHAIGAIAQNVKHTSLRELFAALKEKMAEVGISVNVEDIITLPSFQSTLVSTAAFQSFSLNKVLKFGALLASRGQEYDVSADNSRSPTERLAHQKQNLRRRLAGGLGLNLTSADTLIFMEHDWNPMRDRQAMDRAHRLGQRKVVNVHRLIMRGTLEEKVMSLQKFKVSVAHAIINADNASLRTMNTDQLLDLFASAETGRKGSTQSRRGDENSHGDRRGSGRGLKAVLGGLEELWDQSQYTEESNLNHFLAKLNG